MIIIVIITKSHNNYCSIGVMELCLLSLLILIDVFLCNSYPCVLFESLSHVINQNSHVYSRKLGKIYSLHFLKFSNLPRFNREISKFEKVNSVNLSKISLLNMWLLVQTKQETLRVVTIAMTCSTLASLWKFQYFKRGIYDPVKHLWWCIYWENSKPLSIFTRKHHIVNAQAKVLNSVLLLTL